MWGYGRRVGAVSEKSITRQQAGLVRLARTSRKSPPMSLEAAPLRNSLWRGQEPSTIRQKLSQIGNPGLRLSPKEVS